MIILEEILDVTHENRPSSDSLDSASRCPARLTKLASESAEKLSEPSLIVNDGGKGSVNGGALTRIC